jgi:hypothetical protein
MSFIEEALAHAAYRWCWDDVTFIEEQLEYAGPYAGESPEHWIDSLAESYDLLDPEYFR